MGAKLFLFGQFKWELSTGILVPPLREKTQALISYIALSGSGFVKRREIADLLWEDGINPNASLRQSVREIKTVLADNNSGIFTADAKYLTLDLNKLWIDARLVTQCAGSFKAGLAEQLLDADLGSLMQNCTVSEETFDEWLMMERSRRNNDLNFSLEKLLQYADDNDLDSSRLKRIASKILTIDSTNEIAHRALIGAYFAHGDKASAIQQYILCEKTIMREFGVSPSDETRQLAQSLKSNALVEIPKTRVISTVLQQPVDNELKPIIQIHPFLTSNGDGPSRYYADVFRADVCEQLFRNRRFSVRDCVLTPPSGSLVTSGLNDNVPFSNYTVRGNVLSVGDKLTLMAQLYDGQTGDILWMTRLAPPMEDILSDNKEAAVLAAIEMVRFIELREIEKANTTEDGTLTARQCLRRAVSIMFNFSADAVAKAKRYLKRAMLLHPDYPEAMAWLAFLKSIEVGQGYVLDIETTKEEIGALVRKSIELCPNDDETLAIAGHLEAFIHHDFESAQEFFDRSLSANPNCAYAWGFGAITNCYVGKPEEALAMLERCRLIMPFDPHPYYFDTARCIASMLSGKYEDAVRIGRQVLRNNPNFHANYRPLISSLGHLGSEDDAAPVLLEFVKHQPDFSVSWHIENYPPLDKEKAASYVDGLRKAGVSE
ncbi:MAG: BTAD domain-containing putative transcriptional regulator [Sneathiella sp.]